MAPRRPHLHAPWGAWRRGNRKNTAINQFQLTRSVGSVTIFDKAKQDEAEFQLTRSVGSVTRTVCWRYAVIEFQLTRSVGSVTYNIHRIAKKQYISTHTLRGERDANHYWLFLCDNDFNSHAPWGAWHTNYKQIKKTVEISTHTLRGERDNNKRLY